jgi:hypothetical protein
MWTVGALRRIEMVLKEEGKEKQYSWVGKAVQRFSARTGRKGRVVRSLALTPPQRLSLAAPVSAKMEGVEVVADAVP